MGMAPQQNHTIPTSCAILPTTYALCLLVVCRGGLWKAVGWVVLGVEWMLMCMGSVLGCGWLQCSCYTEHRIDGLSRMQKLWSTWGGSVWYVGVSYVAKFYYCWTWQLWIVFYVEGCGVRSAECSVHLVGVNRLSACREICGMHSWQNGTNVEMVGMCCGVIPY